MARDVYKSCMDVGKIEELGLQPIKNILNELGGWPVLLGPNQTWDGGDNYIWVRSMSLSNNFNHQIIWSDFLVFFMTRIFYRSNTGSSLFLEIFCHQKFLFEKYYKSLMIIKVIS